MRVISLPLVQFAAIPSICKDSKPVVLSGGTPTGGLYSAVKGVSNGMFDPATSGITPGPQTITYAITDPKTGCINSINQTLTILDATKPAWPEFLGTPKTVMCKGDNQTLSLNNAGIYTIQWLSGSTSVGTSASYTISGITQDVLLTIKYKDANNCVSDDKNITIELDKIKADFSTATTSVKVGSAVTFTDLSTNASKWSWTMGLEGPSVSQSPVFYFNIVGTKTIKLITTSSNNCKDSITKTNYITVSNTGVNGVKNAGSDQLVVYPNPIHDIVNIDLTGKNEDVTISIVNMAGVKVIEKQFKDANGIVNIHTSEIPAGTYFMVLDIEGKRYTSKLEKL
jgi:PKD repeat protein